MAVPPLIFTFARDNQVALDGERILAGPEATLDGLREARRVAGRPLSLETVTEAQFLQSLVRIYDQATDQSEETEVVFNIEEVEGLDHLRDLLEDVADAPVIRLVNQLLRQAVRSAASDLHLEPHEDGLWVRMRIDGIMRPIFDRKDVPARRVVSRLKVMAGLDIVETRLPQDGRIALRLGGRAIDVRLSTLPGLHGERIVMRFLDRRSGLVSLDQLGLMPADAEILSRLAGSPHGMVLATGPTGSGKTTTLYSLLNLVRQAERTILTIEDPVEYDLPGVSQIQVNPEIGFSFAKGMRSMLRQDPNVLLVGEIRDIETAHIACEIALIGKLVFSSLHANNALASVVRLRELGVSNHLLSTTLRGVIAQRLVRRLCSACRREVPISAFEASYFKSHALEAPERLFAAEGCEFCDGEGYCGRVGIFDILEIDDRLLHAIDDNASFIKLREVSGRRFSTLFAAGLVRAAIGETTLEEVRQVIGDIA
ncbi:GspE/PulE family protein [Pararhodobacter sp. SW119]|uniref:GspE/PulE family protein n=1 Tax=Pararhodobacter sp. SW119 TaxID=2780075 RepID=UPI001AE0E78A|nr:GspE/PulE family protein [Pararhodobacter sp. SW119]